MWGIQPTESQGKDMQIASVKAKSLWKELSPRPRSTPLTWICCQSVCCRLMTLTAVSACTCTATCASLEEQPIRQSYTNTSTHTSQHFSDIRLSICKSKRHIQSRSRMTDHSSKGKCVTERTHTSCSPLQTNLHQRIRSLPPA